MPPWHRDGVTFTCVGTSCGDCCSGRWGRGYVWLTIDEMQAIAQHLGLPFDDFTRRYVRRVGDRFSLTERLNLDCVFYTEGKGCGVYEARPQTCRAYPFWPRVMRSNETWQAEGAHCPGIGQGEHVDDAQISAALRTHPDAR